MSQWTDYSLLQINFLFSYLNNCISSVFLVNKLIINYLNIPIPNGTHLYMSHLLSISWVLWFCFVTISLLSSKCVWLYVPWCGTNTPDKLNICLKCQPHSSSSSVAARRKHASDFPLWESETLCQDFHWSHWYQMW